MSTIDEVGIPLSHAGILLDSTRGSRPLSRSASRGFDRKLVERYCETVEAFDVKRDFPRHLKAPQLVVQLDNAGYFQI